MKEKKSIAEEASAFVKGLFERQLPKSMLYHSFDHSKFVAESAYGIASLTGLNGNDLELLLLSAWFHDAGYIKCVKGHEDVSVEIAGEFFTKHNYPGESIKKISSAIFSTRYPQSPENFMEDILCDADLCHLGCKDFFEKNELLRHEMENTAGEKFSDKEWLERNIKFFKDHKFFTKAAEELYLHTKEKNLESLCSKYAEL